MSGGGGGSSTTTTNSVTQPGAYAQPYLDDLLNRARTNSGAPAGYYPGQTYLDPTEGQLGAWGTRLGYNDSVFGGANAPNFGEATGALSRQLSGTPDYSGLQGSIDAANKPILRDLNENIIPGLNNRATFLNNPTGGIKTLNRVLPEIGDRMSENAAQLTERERYRALSDQQQGIQNFGSLYGIGQQQGQEQTDFANWGAGFQNQALQDQMGRFNYYQNLPQQNLSNYGSLVMPAAGLGSSNSSTNNQSGGNSQQNAQNAVALMTMLSAMYGS